MGVRFSGNFIPRGKLRFYNPSPNNDVPSIIDIQGPVIFNEGSNGITTFAFNVTRDGYLNRDVTLFYSVIGSGNNPASPSDFEGSIFPSGTITLLRGQTSTSFAINVSGDEIVESDEEFTVLLSTEQPYIEFTNSNAKGVILNDDSQTITFDPPSGSLGTYDMDTDIDLKINVSIEDDYIEKYEIIEGALPEGITLNQISGNISGRLPIVTEDTTYNFIIKVTDIYGNYGLADYTLTVRDTSTEVVWVTPEGTLVDAPSGYSFKRNLEAELK